MLLRPTLCANGVDAAGRRGCECVPTANACEPFWSFRVLAGVLAQTVFHRCGSKTSTLLDLVSEIFRSLCNSVSACPSGSQPHGLHCWHCAAVLRRC